MILDGLNTVAIVDDEADLRAALRQMLELEDLKPIEFADAEAALIHLDADFPGIVLSDLRMPGLDGIGLFNRLSRMDPGLPVIMMSGHGDIATAVDLVRRGAYDFLSKPFEGELLLAAVRRALEKRTLVVENRALREQPAASSSGAILGSSPETEKLRQIVAQLAEADLDVLISGESGVGKSLIAQTLHRRGPGRRKAIVTVDCGTLGTDQAESYLFGHVSSSFTGTQFPRSGQLLLADGSTLVLDHVDALPQGLQSRVQQALEQRLILPIGATKGQTSRFRTISATSANMQVLLDDGRFDRSLFFRLGAYRIEIPPLRQRREDVVFLFRAFLAEAAVESNRDLPTLSARVWRHLHDHHWPGNVRELRSFAAGIALGLDDPTEPIRQRPVINSRTGLKEATAEFEADMIRATLSRSGGDIAASIAALKLPRKTFYDKLTRHGINPNDYRANRSRRASPANMRTVNNGGQ
jgi:two-component system, NtrC family, C4-dicarboxylate transport response regulator DctD